MNIQSWRVVALCGLCLSVVVPGLARAEAPTSPQAASAAAPVPVRPEATDSDKPEPGEPTVRNTVIEDDGARIEELKVRGQSKRITVTPKRGGKPYEIITDKGAHDHTEGPNGLNGAVGKRVWPVMSF